MSAWEKTAKPHGSYIPSALRAHCLSGDSYVPMADAYRICCTENPRISCKCFQEDLLEQLRQKTVAREGTRLYLYRNLRYENAVSENLAGILRANKLHTPDLPEELAVGTFTLSEEQRNAVALALSHRLSMILGGAGCGKSTLIRAIAGVSGATPLTVLCAPTGKAARNLTERTGLPARTVHSALGMHPDEDFLSPVAWNLVRLVIVDEASMMTLEMLAGILCRVSGHCRVVLLGDPNQLLSVGAGNVLPDLLELGVPCAHLVQNHRQGEGAGALVKNVTGFSDLHSGRQLMLDNSFFLREMDAREIRKKPTAEAACRYLKGESVQVLSPYNRAGALSAHALNQVIRELVNPPGDGKPTLTNSRGEKFRSGDRVMILQNDRDKNCSNGDVGVLSILRAEKPAAFCVKLPDGRCPAWWDGGGLDVLSLAYAITVHKAQGSEYDTILFPAVSGMERMLSRNLFYTAISRARRQVVLFGDAQAMDTAMQKRLPPRRSMLVPKTRMRLEACA